MQWSELFQKGNEPSADQVCQYVCTPLWDDLSEHLRQAYNIQPKLFYSGCAMDKGYWKGWNIKYKKSGKALCSLYPKEGYFLALIAVGPKEIVEADLLAPLCCEYTQNLYNRSAFGNSGKSLAFEVTNEDILRDVKSFIALRANCR